MRARDVMLNAGLPHYSEGGCMGLGEHERRDVVESIIDAALSAITSSGYRILGPDEIDAVTVEKCVIEMEANWGHVCTPELRDAIRALCATQQGDK